eukprot:gene10355-13910_t
MGSTNEQKRCGFLEFIVFMTALVAGTACSLTSKVMLNMTAVGMTGVKEKFSYPLFQTLGMFLGMMAGLLMHALVIRFKITFPGYEHKQNSAPVNDYDDSKSIPSWMYFMLIIPSIFDLSATALCMFGLRYVDVSTYQMLRGSAIIFVALLKHFAIGDKLKKFMWIGILWNVVSIILVGLTAVFNSDTTQNESETYNNPVLGISLIMLGALVQSLQYAFEEKVMNLDLPIPPLLLIGMEGLWGTIICVTILYPIFYFLPGSDHGSVENPFNTYAQIMNSSSIQIIFVLYFFSVLAYNILATLVTFMLSAVWHAILDNFRPITVWSVDLIIYYMLSKAFGEAWTSYSYLQVVGMFVLIYGTAIYNAPNQGSIRLSGEWYSLYLDFTDEYSECEEELENIKRKSLKKNPSFAPYYTTMSPLKSPIRTSLTNRLTGESDNIQQSNRLMRNDAESGIAYESFATLGDLSVKENEGVELIGNSRSGSDNRGRYGSLVQQ